jgi:drug/metabolite transporter (DMT)-like permease
MTAASFTSNLVANFDQIEPNRPLPKEDQADKALATFQKANKRQKEGWFHPEVTIVRTGEKKTGKKEVLMLSCIVVLWGASFTLLKIGLEGIPPIDLAFLRFLIAIAFFVVAGYLLDREIFHLDVLRDWKLLLAIGLAGVTLCNVFQNVGLEYTTASNSSLLLASNPVFITLFARVFLKEKMKAMQAMGVGLALLGIVFIVGPSKLSFGLGSAFGDLLSLLAAISWAVSSIISKEALSRHGALAVAFFSNLFGTAFLLPPLFLFERLILPSSLSLWFLLAVLGLFCSGLAYFLWYRVLEDVPATEAGVSLFFIPVVSVSIAFLVLSEPLDFDFLVGAALVISGVVLTQRG